MRCVEKIEEIVRDAARFGFRELENGARLAGHLPHNGPKAYLHVAFAPLSKDDIRIVEQEIERPLPDPLRSFYGFFNGMMLYSHELAINGLRRNFARTGDESRQPFSIVTPNTIGRPLGSDPSAVYFGSYYLDGSTLSMSPEHPEVRRCARYTTTVLNMWPSFDDMLLSEIERLGGLFDATGRQIDPNCPTTPTPTTGMN